MSGKLIVNGAEIAVTVIDDKDYISLTDMLKAKDGDFFISDWLRNRNTVEFLGIWEQIHNPDFNYGEFAIIKSQAGLNSYKISVKEWVEKTNAIGIRAKAGRYGGTYAYKDIAFEFGMWISPEFKIYLIKEFERLKEAERLQFGWDIRRNLAKINYRIHTDAIKENLIPPELSPKQTSLVYANAVTALKRSLPEILSVNTRMPITEYDRIILGAPIWAETVCPLAKAFLHRYGPLINGKVFYVITHMARNPYDTPISLLDDILGRPHSAHLSVSTKNENLESEIETFISQIQIE